MTTEYRDDPEDGLREIPPLTDDEDDPEDQDQTLHVRSNSESSQPLPLPVWLRESAKTFKFRWVPLPLRKAGRATADWIKGPIPPKELRVRPWFPMVQEAPIKLLDKYVPKRRHRLMLLALFYACWLLTWSLMLAHNSTSGYIKGYGKPSNIWCGASFWNNGNGCGLNGNECRPFSSAHMAFRCPADCLSVELLNPHTVGNQTLQYKGLVVGGPRPDDPDFMPIYRGDSFICQAAIHAGVTTDGEGGCGVATLLGSHSDFKSTNQHGVESTSFPSTFPRSFTFQKLLESQAQCPTDSRWPLFVVTAAALVILSLFTTSPAAFFFSIFVLLIIHVGIVSDPPNLSSFAEKFSMLLSRFLPATFIAFILYRYCAVPLLSGLTAQIEKTILYLGFCFIGGLNNYTFAPIIPIARLTQHDLGAQPGAPLALAIILIVIIAIVIGQIHYIRISGNMPMYLALYITFVVGLLILTALPGLRLRIHHYILALLFMPGTAFQTRPGLAYQGLLLGLFINGVARWGFASIVETPTALGESGDGSGSGGSWWGATSPNITALVAPDLSNITFNWGELPTDKGIDGVSILINDVERWRGYVDSELYWDEEEVTLKRREIEEPQQERGQPEPEFFRFAWMNGNSAGRYSKVGIWDETGAWQPIPGK